MKWIPFILLLVPLSVLGQYDFESRYFSMDNASLSEVPEVFSFDLTSKDSNLPLIKDLSDFNQINAKNYWQPVDMAQAMAEEQKMKSSGFDTEALQQKFNSNYRVQSYGKDASTKVTNPVYKEQRGLDLLAPCPPFGICSRCAPYRIGRGF